MGAQTRGTGSPKRAIPSTQGRCWKHWTTRVPSGATGAATADPRRLCEKFSSKKTKRSWLPTRQCRMPHSGCSCRGVGASWIFKWRRFCRLGSILSPKFRQQIEDSPRTRWAILRGASLTRLARRRHRVAAYSFPTAPLQVDRIFVSPQKGWRVQRNARSLPKTRRQRLYN